MPVHVACSSCHQTFPAETHSGLVRCVPCEDRAAPRIPHAAGTVVEFEGVWA